MNKLNKYPVQLWVLFFLYSCSGSPDPIKLGKDQCQFCKMTISEARFGGVIFSKKGRTYKFDDLSCVKNFLKTQDLEQHQIKNIYLSDFCGSHSLIETKQIFLLQSEKLRSPMNSNIAAFANEDSLKTQQALFPGTILSWEKFSKE